MAIEYEGQEGETMRVSFTEGGGAPMIIIDGGLGFVFRDPDQLRDFGVEMVALWKQFSKEK